MAADQRVSGASEASGSRGRVARGPTEPAGRAVGCTVVAGAGQPREHRSEAIAFEARKVPENLSDGIPAQSGTNSEQRAVHGKS